jgi:hypothetical protein
MIRRARIAGAVMSCCCGPAKRLAARMGDAILRHGSSGWTNLGLVSLS